MHTDDVRVFLAAVAAGSLSSAGRRLGISPMAATRRLAALEAALGVRLMHRTTRALSLTPEGETFLPYAEVLSANEQEAVARLRAEGRGAAGLLRVSAPVAFGERFLAPLVPRLLEANPDLSIAFDLDDELRDLVATGTDLAIRIGRLRDSGLVARKLADNRRALFAAPAYVARRGLPAALGDLAGHDCLPFVGQQHWTFVCDGSERTVRIGVRFASSSIVGIRGACLAGAGIALLSDWLVDEDVAAGRLVRLTIAGAEPEESAISALYPSRQMLLPKVRVFIDALEASLAARLAGRGG